MSRPAKWHKLDPPAATPDPAKFGPFYKILRKDLIHHKFTYQLGLNVDSQPFQPERECHGGLYFSDLEHIAEYFAYGDLVARVALPSDARWIQEEPGKFKADRILLSDIQPWREWDLWNHATFAKQALKQNGLHLQYVRHQPPKLCLTAVQQNGYALQYVKDQTPQICLAAVQQDGWALQYVQHQTPQLCLAAVQRDGWALHFVQHQTPQLCLAAVQRDGWALHFVQHQTPEICLAAVQENGGALRYVKDQTPEICLAAVQENGRALRHVKNQTPQICSAAVQNDGRRALRYVKIPIPRSSQQP